MNDNWFSLLKNVRKTECDKIEPVFLEKKKDSSVFIATRLLSNYDPIGKIYAKVGGQKHRIDFSLDLHGFSIDSAYNVFKDTITEFYIKDIRCLLVITGFGSGSGLIRQGVIAWVVCKPFSDVVLSCTQASRFHGGVGAFYIILKRKN